jgi:hypothetical protein
VKALRSHKINLVTVGVEWPRQRMLNIFSSPEYVSGGWKIQYRLSVRLKGNMTIGRFNLIPRRVDIFESATFHQLYYKSNLRFTEQQLDPGVRTQVIFVRAPCFSNLAIKSIYSLWNNDWKTTGSVQRLFHKTQIDFISKFVKHYSLTNWRRDRILGCWGLVMKPLLSHLRKHKLGSHKWAQEKYKRV